MISRIEEIKSKFCALMNDKAQNHDLLMEFLGIYWIVSTNPDSKGEFGIMVMGVQFWYYKYSDPMIAERGYRRASKREFGEVIKSKLEE